MSVDAGTSTQNELAGYRQQAANPDSGRPSCIGTAAQGWRPHGTSMNKRALLDIISEDEELSELGIVANLVFDRLLTITDEAGICPGEPRVVQGKCFPMFSDMTIKKVGTAIDQLIEAKVMYRGYWKDKLVLCFEPESFQRYQGFRKDYKRKFNYGKLSQTVWDKGLAGFRAAVHENRAAVPGSVASVTGTVTVTVTDTVSGANARGVEFDDFYQHYPRKASRGAAEIAWKELDVAAKRLAIEAAPLFAKAWAGSTNIKKCAHPATWLNGKRWLDDPAEWERMAAGDEKPNPRMFEGAEGGADDYRDLPMTGVDE